MCGLLGSINWPFRALLLVEHRPMTPKPRLCAPSEQELPPCGLGSCHTDVMKLVDLRFILDVVAPDCLLVFENHTRKAKADVLRRELAHGSQPALGHCNRLRRLCGKEHSLIRPLHANVDRFVALLHHISPLNKKREIPSSPWTRRCERMRSDEANYPFL